MTIELSRETENRIKETAQAQGLSVGQYVETLVAETEVRRTQLKEFRKAIAERMQSLDEGENEDGEQVMVRLISGVPVR